VNPHAANVKSDVPPEPIHGHCIATRAPCLDPWRSSHDLFRTALGGSWPVAPWDRRNRRGPVGSDRRRTGHGAGIVNVPQMTLTRRRTRRILWCIEGWPRHNATRLVLVGDYSAAKSFKAPRTSGMNSLPPPCPASSRVRSRLVVHRWESCQAVTSGPLTSYRP
jgi:hypothetical protein